MMDLFIILSHNQRNKLVGAVVNMAKLVMELVTRQQQLLLVCIVMCFIICCLFSKLLMNRFAFIGEVINVNKHSHSGDSAAIEARKIKAKMNKRAVKTHDRPSKIVSKG